MSDSVTSMSLISGPVTEPLQDILQRACDTFSDPIFVKDRQHRWIAGNAAFFALFGRPASEILGKSDPDFFPKEQAEVFWRNDDELFRNAVPSENEEQLTDGKGNLRIIWTRKYPIFADDRQVVALSAHITDVTRIRGALEKSVRLEAEVQEQQRVIATQGQLLSQLAVPVIQIWEGIVLLPLIGEINGQRGEQIMEALLHAVTAHRARYALIDITGVPLVDAGVARYLVQSVQAAGLLGCQGIMVGIGAGVASQLVKLGTDFSSLITQSTLQQGLEFAMKRLSFVIEQPARKRL
jgi:rsbT co-antagonist protein RsbR